jgi:hypothetical protein
MGIASFALAGAPIAGGALLGVAAGNLRGTDVRALIKQDLELMKLLPDDELERRAELQRIIDMRIDDIIAGVDKNRSLLEVAQSYRGNWRDIVVFICAVLFTVVWWNVPHERNNWLAMLIVMILVSILAAVYAGRGMWRSLRSLIRSQAKTTRQR